MPAQKHRGTKCRALDLVSGEASAGVEPQVIDLDVDNTAKSIAWMRAQAAHMGQSRSFEIFPVSSLAWEWLKSHLQVEDHRLVRERARAIGFWHLLVNGATHKECAEKDQFGNVLNGCQLTRRETYLVVLRHRFRLDKKVEAGDSPFAALSGLREELPPACPTDEVTQVPEKRVRNVINMIPSQQPTSPPPVHVAPPPPVLVTPPPPTPTPVVAPPTEPVVKGPRFLQSEVFVNVSTCMIPSCIGVGAKLLPLGGKVLVLCVNHAKEIEG